MPVCGTAGTPYFTGTKTSKAFDQFFCQNQNCPTSDWRDPGVASHSRLYVCGPVRLATVLRFIVDLVVAHSPVGHSAPPRGKPPPGAVAVSGGARGGHSGGQIVRAAKPTDLWRLVQSASSTIEVPQWPEWTLAETDVATRLLPATPALARVWWIAATKWTTRA